MAKINTETVDGWPMMTPLGKKESALLAQHLVPGETVLGQVIGSFGQAVVATPHKVLIVKTGLMAGQTFGGKATSFDYRTIVGIEVRTTLIQGDFEIISGGLVNNQRNGNGARVAMAEQPNGLVFRKVDVAAFNMMAAKIRELSASAHTATDAPAPASAATLSIADELTKFAALRDQGILTEEEFQTRKAALLA